MEGPNRLMDNQDFFREETLQKFEEILQQKIAKRVGQQRVKNGKFILLLKIGCIHYINQ